jgi:hypothetical protein
VSSYAHVDKSRFPVVTITFGGGSPTDENCDEYLREMAELYDSGEELVIIMDARKSSLPSLKQQQRQAQWMKRHDSMLRKQCLGTAYVLTTGATRMILSMIFAITPQPVPYKICTNLPDAEEWVQDQLRD